MKRLFVAAGVWIGVLISAVGQPTNAVFVGVQHGQASPITNRNLLLTPLSVTASPGLLASRAKIQTTTGTDGGVWLSNMLSGVWQVEVLGPPYSSTARWLVYVDPTNAVQWAGSNVVASSTSTYPPDQVAWSASASDLRYLKKGEAGLDTNAVVELVEAGVVGLASTGHLAAAMSTGTVAQAQALVGGAGSNWLQVVDPATGNVVMGVRTNDNALHANGAGLTNVPQSAVTGLPELQADVDGLLAGGGGGVAGTNVISVSGNTTDGSYVTLWTNAPAGSNWVATIGVTVVGSGPVNRYVEEITWSVVCSNGVTWVASTNGTRAGKSSYLQSFDEVDEFTHVGVGWATGPFGLYFSTTGGGVGNANPRDGISTIAALNTGTSASAVVSVRSGVNVVDASMYTGITNEWRILVDDLSTTAEHFAMRSGFQDSFAAAADVDAACFVYSQTTNSGKFLAFCSAGSVTTTADTGVTVVADSWYRLQIALAGGKAYFFINGTLVATITTHVPGSGNYMGFGTTLLKQAGTGTRYLMMDFCRLGFELPTSR